MPLAIELAAARSASLGLDGLLAGLDDHLRLLSRSGAHDDRHSSMRTVIEWSHQLLDDVERAMFRRLGVFAGTFDLDSAAAVAGDGDVAATSDVIGRLADKSLLVRRNHGAGSRWRMLDTVRAYAREQLDLSGEEPAASRRHLRWAADTAREIEASLDDRGGWQSHFDVVSDDLRAALQAADPQTSDGVDFALALALGHLTTPAGSSWKPGTTFTRPWSGRPTTGRRGRASAWLPPPPLPRCAERRLFTCCRRLFRPGPRPTRGSAAMAMADAATIGGRCPALFVEPRSSRAELGSHGSGPVSAAARRPRGRAHVALAAAWDGGIGRGKPDRSRAGEALVSGSSGRGPRAHKRGARRQRLLRPFRRSLQGRLPVERRAARSSWSGSPVTTREPAGRSSTYSTWRPRRRWRQASSMPRSPMPAVLPGQHDPGPAPFRRQPHDHSPGPAGRVRRGACAGPRSCVRDGRSRQSGGRMDGPVLLRHRPCARPARRREAYAEWWDLAMRISQMQETGRQSCSLFVGPRVALHLGASTGLGRLPRRSTRATCAATSVLTPRP